jgi:hypothetical protein
MKQHVNYIRTASSTTELLDRVQMNAADRAAAKATVIRAEAIADVLYRVTEEVQAAVESIGRGARALAQRVRARFA